MPPAGFEPTILAGERPQTHALDRAATWTGVNIDIIMLILIQTMSKVHQINEFRQLERTELKEVLPSQTVVRYKAWGSSPALLNSPSISNIPC